MGAILSFQVIEAFEHCEGKKFWIDLSVKKTSFAAMQCLQSRDVAQTG